MKDIPASEEVFIIILGKQQISHIAYKDKVATKNPAS